MGTPTPTPAEPTLVQIDKDLQDALAALASKHVTVSYTLIGVLLLVLALTGIGGYFAVQMMDKEISRADTAEKTMEQDKQQYISALQKYQQQLAIDSAQRAADAQKESQLEAALIALNRATQTKVTDVTTPGKSAQDTFIDLKAAYADNKTVSAAPLNVAKDATGEQLMTFPVPVVQQFSATKIELDGCYGETTNLNQQLSTEREVNQSLNTDLSNSQLALAELQKTEAQCEATVKDYKKVVAPSKFKKVMGVTLKVVIFIAGAALGHYI